MEKRARALLSSLGKEQEKTRRSDDALPANNLTEVDSATAAKEQQPTGGK